MTESQILVGMPRTVVIVGPTAVGKSRLALELAQQLGGDLVSADSRQVYRYMDIGTDKPSAADREVVSHYLLDLVAPDDPYTVQRYVREGTRVLRRVAAEGRVAFVAGGTGFYIRGLIDRAAVPEVPPEAELRKRLRLEAEERGSQALHDRLRELDPRSAERIHPNNLPRLVRALEIVELTGRPVPVAAPNSGVPALFLGLNLPREKLREAAAKRIDRQIERGLVRETELLLSMGYSPSLPALDGFGYRQMIAYLEGRASLDQAIAEYRTATFKYIRRQMTWFAADKRIQWLEAREGAVERAHALVASHLEVR